MKSIILNQSGQGLTEYITILILVSLVAVGVSRQMGNKIKSKISQATTAISRDIQVNTKGSARKGAAAVPSDDQGDGDDDGV